MFIILKTKDPIGDCLLFADETLLYISFHSWRLRPNVLDLKKGYRSNLADDNPKILQSERHLCCFVVNDNVMSL